MLFLARLVFRNGHHAPGRGGWWAIPIRSRSWKGRSVCRTDGPHSSSSLTAQGNWQGPPRALWRRHIQKVGGDISLAQEKICSLIILSIIQFYVVPPTSTLHLENTFRVAFKNPRLSELKEKKYLVMSLNFHQNQRFLGNKFMEIHVIDP